MPKKILLFSILAGLALMLAVGATATPALAKHGNKAGRVEGKITLVDTVAQTITIQGKKGQVVTLQVNGATKIEVDEVHAFLADLNVGDRVEARFDPGTLIASKIESEGL